MYSPGELNRSLVEEIQMTGKYRGKTAYVFHILGRRAGFTSTSVLNDVREFGSGTASNAVLAGNESLEIVSDSANDTNGGTGTNSVKVTYINTSDQLVESNEITLNGVTPVSAGFNAKEILWMEAFAGGSGEVSAGNIILRIVGSTELEKITAGGNKSMSARFQVPTGYTGYLLGWEGYAIGTTQDVRIRAQVNTLTRSLSNRFLFQDAMYLASGESQIESLSFLKIPALSKVKASTLAGATQGTNRIDVNFDIAIIAN